MSNKNLCRAKKARNDEFYTQYSDIEKELQHYEKHFRGKVVYCNCDSEDSEFWHFFVDKFKAWGLKKIIATHYEQGEGAHSYVLELCADAHDAKPIKTPLYGNGDFRSAECIEYLKQADIVVTNPPFSLFREYVAQLVKYDKKFLIIGNINAVTYKEIFPLFKENKMWLGYGFNAGRAYFRIPEDVNINGYVNGTYNSEMHCVKFGNCCWYTNFDIPKRHEPLALRGKYFGSGEKYPHYKSYDAIEVSKIADIPSDYYGVMGVPVTFLDKYCPEQFEIIGFA